MAVLVDHPEAVFVLSTAPGPDKKRKISYYTSLPTLVKGLLKGEGYHWSMTYSTSTIPAEFGRLTLLRDRERAVDLAPEAAGAYWAFIDELVEAGQHPSRRHGLPNPHFMPAVYRRLRKTHAADLTQRLERAITEGR